MEEDKQNQKISFADYLDLYVKHESKCLLNHVGSSSVSIICLFVTNR